MDLAALLPTLRSQREALQKERDAIAERAARAQASLEGMLRQRDAAEQEVVRLRNLTTALTATRTPSDTAPSKQEAP